MLYKKIVNLNLIGILLFITGCSATDEKVVLTDPNILYKDGITELNTGNYSSALKKFETIEKEHSASLLASYAQIRRAYANYLEEKYDDAIFALDDFISQYPLHANIDYAYYLRALCYYDRIVDVGRDQHITYKAIEALNSVVIRFPNSKYARDAKLKAEYALNNLAGKEMEIGRFYLNNNELVAALNRFKTVIDKYQTSIFTPEALYRVSEIYFTLGDENQAKQYAAVLGTNYLNNSWYEQAYHLNTDKNYSQSRPWYHGFKKIW